MSKSNHTEAQMIGALKQVEGDGKWKMWWGTWEYWKHTLYA
jgi:hypothetical protein